MAVEDYLVHTHQSPDFKKDQLTIWRPVNGSPLPVIQIDQPGHAGYMAYKPEDALAIAQAILEAAGLDYTITIQNAA